MFIGRGVISLFKYGVVIGAIILVYWIIRTIA